MAWKDTIKELFTLGNYTLLQYIKGGEDEWCVALFYDSETKSWASGNYSYSFEAALASILFRNGSNLVKDTNQVNIEDKYGLTYDRLSELATQFKDGLIEDDEEQAMIYFDETCEMTDEEKEYFGIDTESEEE